MPLTKQGAFTFDHSNQQDDLYKVKTAAEIKQAFDSRGIDLKNTINNLIDSLQSVVDGNSGADSIGVTPILTSPSTLQGVLEWLQAQIAGTALGVIPEGSVTLSKLNFDPATQTELDGHKTESAAETTKGHIQLATTTETTTGTDNTKAVHPAGLKVELDKKISKSLLTAAGDILYASAPNTPTILAKGTNGQTLGLAGGLPSWVDGAKIVTSTYIGDGATSRTINLGFTPKYVILHNGGVLQWNMYNTGNSLEHVNSSPYHTGSTSTIVANGILVKNADDTNANGTTYTLIAFA